MVTLNRPQKLNSFTPAMLRDLSGHLGDIAEDEFVRVLVLKGEGDRAFSTGADLSSFLGEGRDGLKMLAPVLAKLMEFPMPTIAAVRGFALAGGFGLALSCDMIVASEDAQFGLPEIDRGIWPFMVTVPLLRALPRKVALELMMTGRRIGGGEAYSMGLVSQLYAVDDWEAGLQRLTGILKVKSPEALRAGKEAFAAVEGMGAEDALDEMAERLAEFTVTDSARQGIIAFTERKDKA